MPNRKLAVIGAGITGLSTAFHLQEAGLPVDLFERKGEPGGAIKTVRSGGWQIEYGPNTLLLKDRKIAELIGRLGLFSEMVAANPNAKRRYIVKNGILQDFPSSLLAAVKTPLFTGRAKLRVLNEAFIPKSSDINETVAQFVERRLGREILDYAVNPFVGGIFANRPEELSLQHAFPVMDQLEQEYGSLTWGAIAGLRKRKRADRIRKELISFKRGMQQLPLTIASKLNHCYYNHQIKKIVKKGGGWYLLSQMGDFGPYEHVVVNIPLYKWTDDLLPVNKEQIELSRSVNYPPLSVMLLGYRKEDVEHPLNGFGFLVPEKENRKILGALFTSTLFRNRAPEGYHLLTVFVGGGRRPELTEMDSDDMLAMIQMELKELIGAKENPAFKEHIFWPNSIPAYHIGYDRILNQLDELEKKNHGLHFAGNFRDGVSVPDCIKNGMELAERLHAEMSHHADL